MNKYMIVFLATVLISGCLLLSVYSQEEMEIVDNEVFTSPQRASSSFLHDEHNEIAEIEECYECHHLYENGIIVEEESSEEQECSECHKENSSNGYLPLRKAYHTSCKGCHLERKKGPIMCGECHVKWKNPTGG